MTPTGRKRLSGRAAGEKPHLLREKNDDFGSRKAYRGLQPFERYRFHRRCLRASISLNLIQI